MNKKLDHKLNHGLCQSVKSDIKKPDAVKLYRAVLLYGGGGGN
jgi:hypothetical protein